MNTSLAPLPDPVAGEPEGRDKSLMFLGFLSQFTLWFAGVLLVRALFFTATGENAVREGQDAIPLGMVSDIPWIIGTFVLAAILILFVVGRERTATGWAMGKGLIAPIVVIGVVLGSIYGGITGITEAAGMGVIAVFVIGLIRREMTFDIVWDSLIRTLQVHRHDHLGDHRCGGACGGLHAGRRADLCGQPDRRGGHADDGDHPGDDAGVPDHGDVHGLGRHRAC